MWPTERINTKPQAIPDSAQGFDVSFRGLGPRILQREGAHRQPQDFCTEVWIRQLYCQKVLFAETSRCVIGHLNSRRCATLCQHPLEYWLCLTPPFDSSLLVESLQRFVHVYVCGIELSNLLVMRQGIDHRVNDSLSLNMTQLRFHQIKDKEIIQVRRPTCTYPTSMCFPLTSFVFAAL